MDRTANSLAGAIVPTVFKYNSRKYCNCGAFSCLMIFPPPTPCLNKMFCGWKSVAPCPTRKLLNILLNAPNA